MISTIRIENYRSIETLKFFPTALCALLGENNSGKTNILRAVHSVLGKSWHRALDFTRDDHLDQEEESDVLIELSFDPPPTYRPFKFVDPIKIPRLSFTLTRYRRNTASAQKGDPRLDAQCLTRDGKPIQVPREAPKTGVKTPYGPLLNIPGSVKDQVATIYVGTDRRLRGQLPTARSSLLRRLLEDVDRAVKTNVASDDSSRTVADVFFERLDDALAVLRVPEFLQLEELLRTKAIENLGMTQEEGEQSFRLYFGLSDTFEFFKAMRVMVQEYDRLLDALQLGDGAQNAIVIAVFQAYERMRKQGAIFLLEEPEMYLHPQKCRFFYRTLRSLSSTNQVIYSTHSPYFVTVPEYEEVRLVSRDGNGRTAVAASSLEPDVGLREKIRKELDPERNELFFARHVILVEGDTEKLALPEYAARLGIDLDRLGVSIVEVGGKRGLEPFARIVKSFGLLCTIVFDTDSSDFLGDTETESTYNRALHNLADETTDVVEMEPKYENVLRSDFGDELYEQLAKKYGGTSKAIRARRIAEDETTPIPSVIEEMFSTITAT